MSRLFTSEPFSAMATRLSRINVDNLVDDALQEAADEYAQGLRELHHYAGADEPLVAAIRPFKDGPHQVAAGVPSDSPQAANARTFEYGSDDHEVRPSGIFRLEEPSMAKHAAGNVSSMLAARIGNN